MKYQFMDNHYSEFTVRKMCQTLEVSNSRYYAWRKKPHSKRENENLAILEKIKEIHKKSRNTYGSPRIYNEMKNKGIKSGENRIARIMQENGIRSKTKKKFKITTCSKHNLPVAENVLNRNFQIKKPNMVWTSDITYVETNEGWLYTCVVLDLCSKRVIGWSMEANMTTEMVLKALNMAITNRNPQEGIIFHTDRGKQYASEEFRKRLREKNFIQSMSRKGNCWDNAPTESFFKTLKVEELYFKKFITRKEAKGVIFEYMEGFYNTQRIHSSLGYLSPFMFEKLNNIA